MSRDFWRAGKVVIATQLVYPSVEQLAGAGVALPETPARVWPVIILPAAPEVFADGKAVTVKQPVVPSAEQSAIVPTFVSSTFKPRRKKAVVRIYCEENINPRKLVVHSDNGSPLKGATMQATMQRLG